MDITSQELESLQVRATSEALKTKQFFQKLRRRPPAKLDLVVHDLHQRVFKDVDCLKCANCCKSISPIVRDRDIDRMARALRISPSELISRHLHLDSDGDYVFTKQPCPFLLSDNYCSIYEDRPKACREYPHTDRRKFEQLFNLTLKNTFVCPAAYRIVDLMKQHPDLR
jgi:Predicted Fe-S-cluster oxidoreductase